jgi:hypothetical protein
VRRAEREERKNATCMYSEEMPWHRTLVCPIEKVALPSAELRTPTAAFNARNSVARRPSSLRPSTERYSMPGTLCKRLREQQVGTQGQGQVITQCDRSKTITDDHRRSKTITDDRIYGTTKRYFCVLQQLTGETYSYTNSARV